MQKSSERFGSDEVTQYAQEWLDLLPWSTTEERRALFDSEYAAAAYANALHASGISQRDAFAPVAFAVFAEVLAVVHGEPWGLLA